MSADNRLPHEILLAIAQGEAIDGHMPTLAERSKPIRDIRQLAIRLQSIQLTQPTWASLRFVDQVLTVH